MKRLVAVLSTLLVACSGAAGVDITSTSAPEPTTSVSFAPEEGGGAVREDSGSRADSTVQDAGSSDSGSAQDSGSLAADAGGQDAGQPDSEPVEPTRYGVTFDGSQGQRVLSPLPAETTGAQVVTFEGWFRYDAVANQAALLFQTPAFYGAVATSGPHTGELATCILEGQVCAYSGLQFTVGAWHHVATVLDHGALCLYQDGLDHGCVATGIAQFPQVSSTPGLDSSTRLAFGAGAASVFSSKTSVDEFRVSLTRRYAGAYAVPKHLASDADAKLTLMLDDGAGPTSGTATLYGGASWIVVAR